MANLEERVRAMFLGVFIGDRLGLPVETWTAERIKDQHGRITDYAPSKSDWSDDTQLTLAVAEGLIKKPLCMDAQAEAHASAYEEGVYGMGKSTKRAIRALSEGTAWDEVSSDGTGGAGLGNGIAMKISPVAAFHALRAKGSMDVMDFALDLASMTHNTEMGLCSGIAHMYAIYHCLNHNNKTFITEGFLPFVKLSAAYAKSRLSDYDATSNDDNFMEHLKILDNHSSYNFERIVANLEGGCYACHSLPFTYMFFLNNNSNIEVLYDVVSAGGDTDSNGSMIAAMLGAKHGMDIFPDHLVDGLNQEKKERVLDVADRFVEKFMEAGEAVSVTA
jgi:ADP-ribosylglycohydrolase